VGNHGVIVGVGADPKPDDDIAFSNAKRSPADSYSNGVDRLLGMDSLEIKAGMVLVFHPEFVFLFCSYLNSGGKFGEKRAEPGGQM